MCAAHVHCNVSKPYSHLDEPPELQFRLAGAAAQGGGAGWLVPIKRAFNFMLQYVALRLPPPNRCGRPSHLKLENTMRTREYADDFMFDAGRCSAARCNVDAH